MGQVNKKIKPTHLFKQMSLKQNSNDAIDSRPTPYIPTKITCIVIKLPHIFLYYIVSDNYFN